MKKSVLFLFIALLSVHTFGFEGGGVDVGNSNPRAKFALPVFNSEAAMVAHVNALLPQIEKGELKEVQDLMKKGKCSEGFAKFNELSVIPSYEYNKTTKKLDKEFSGEVFVELKDCKRPRKL